VFREGSKTLETNLSIVEGVEGCTMDAEAPMLCLMIGVGDWLLAKNFKIITKSRSRHHSTVSKVNGIRISTLLIPPSKEAS
jgi:hypothetical protein